MLHCHDVRNSGSKPLWTLQAHDEPLTSFSVNPIIPGFIATGSTDKTIKLWNVGSPSDSSQGPTMVVSRNMDVGKVFSVSFAPDTEVGFRLAVAGSQGTLKIWDTSTNAAVRRIFADRVAPSNGNVQERIIGVDEAEDDEDEEEEGEDNEEGGVALESESGKSEADSDDSDVEMR
jgi:periodic tryptophan protein 1